jgi:hypothetical protein
MQLLGVCVAPPRSVIVNRHVNDTLQLHRRQHVPIEYSWTVLSATELQSVIHMSVDHH